MVSGEVLESQAALGGVSFVMRPQAERIVQLIGQGWGVDIIFERVGVEIRD